MKNGDFDMAKSKLLKDNIKQFLINACSVKEESINTICNIMLED